jgi:predicted NBD/HSP70 family sugar kinase/biotin operon repressor
MERGEAGSPGPEVLGPPLGSEDGGSLGSLRESNRDRVIATLRVLGVASRAEIARRTGLSRSTVSSIVADLRDAGLVVDRQDGEGPAEGAGRPPALLSLDPAAGYAVGVDFGKRHLAVAVADLSHRVLAEEWREMGDGYGAEEGMGEAADVVGRLLDAAGADRDRILGLGMGLPGPVHRSGTVGSGAILPGWVGVSAAEAMAARVELPVLVENDANLGALSEFVWGAGRGRSSIVFLKIATGVGAGLVIDGRVFQGAGGTAGEIGHTTIDEAGDICRCGNRGCLETYAGAPALMALLERSLGEELEPDQIIERAEAGDLMCRRALADAGRHVGVAVANLCNLVNPECIVVGGSIGAAGGLLVEPLRESVRRRAIPSAAEDVEIVPAQLGERAELLGAVALVLRGAGAVAGSAPAEVEAP